MVIRHRYIPVPARAASRHGLSERHVRRLLEREGWTVWRGGMLRAPRRDPEQTWPNVLAKYQQLIVLLNEHRPGTVDELQYLCHVHHGMPDFLAYRGGEFRFVECKLGHEQLNERQRKCLPRLQRMGFSVEVWKLADPCTKRREALIDVENGETEVVEQQLRLKLRWPRNPPSRL